MGRPASKPERTDFLAAMADSMPTASSLDGDALRLAVQAIVDGKTPEAALGAADLPPGEATLTLLRELHHSNAQLSDNGEIRAILHALDGGFLRPAPGGDVVRMPSDAAHRPQSARLRSFPHSERLCGARRRPPGDAPDREAHGGHSGH